MGALTRLGAVVRLCRQGLKHGDHLVTYLEVTDADGASEGFIRSVMLGPLAGGAHAADAIRLHYRNHFLDSHHFSDKKLQVQVSATPYRA